MTTYTPDNWVVVKVKGDDPHYRVLAGWSGGYLDGDSWRMNSGITEVNASDDYFYFKGSSGSDYRCGKGSYLLRMNNAGAWARLKKLHGDKVEMMPEDTDWLHLDWKIDKESKMSDDPVKKLRSQIGDDVQEVYLAEALFRSSADRIEELEAKLAILEERIASLADHIEKVMEG